MKPCGFFICEGYPFVGATPDGTLYDPSNSFHPFGFKSQVSVFSQGSQSSLACAVPGFCSQLQTLPDGTPHVKVK